MQKKIIIIILYLNMKRRKKNILKLKRKQIKSITIKTQSYLKKNNNHHHQTTNTKKSNIGTIKTKYFEAKSFKVTLRRQLRKY